MTLSAEDTSPMILHAQAAVPLLVLDHVSKTYRTGGATRPILTAATFALHRSETTSLVGASGSGKSTLLSLIAGLLRPDAGRIVFDGQDISQLDDVGRARLRANRIGVVLQSGNLIPFLTATENVELAMGLAGGRRVAPRARELLSEVGLAHRLHHLPKRLSGGEAQRVSLALALVNEPDLLLADEVAGALDSRTAEQVIGIIFAASRERGLTVLFVTHSSELAARAQRHLRLADGRVGPT